jgi:hypothetical protein
MRYVSMALLVGLGVFSALVCSAQPLPKERKADKVAPRVFELRTYTAADGKMEALHRRFRDHTCALFKKHGMTIIGFWSPVDEDGAKTKLIYLLAFHDRETARRAWQDFRDDPEWKKVKEESETDGSLLAKPPESVFLNPTDYSPMK